MYLTKNELEIMDVLWSSGRALSRGEILSLSEGKSWMDSSVHILLNSMLKKGAIREAGFVKCGKTSGRVYAAALSCAQYHISTLQSTVTKAPATELLQAYLEQVKPETETLRKMEKILKEERDRRKKALAE